MREIDATIKRCVLRPKGVDLRVVPQFVSFLRFVGPNLDMDDI